MDVPICPHPNCEEFIKKNEYACKGHWLDLPENLRSDIWAGFRGNRKLWVETDKKIKAIWASEDSGCEVEKTGKTYRDNGI